jgi:hypothetical protein
MYNPYVIVDENGYELDVVLVEKEDEDGNPVPVPDFYVPPNHTKRLWRPKWNFHNKQWEEGRAKEEILESVRESHFQTLSHECQKAILGYFEAEVRGETYLFSFDAEAQLNFTGTLVLFNDGILSEIEWTAHKDGEALRLVLTRSEFMRVVAAGFAHKNDKISRLRGEIQEAIEQATTVEEIEAIEWETNTTEAIE